MTSFSRKVMILQPEIDSFKSGQVAALIPVGALLDSETALPGDPFLGDVVAV